MLESAIYKDFYYVKVMYISMHCNVLSVSSTLEC